MKKTLIICLSLFLTTQFILAQEENIEKLPPPIKEGGMPLMEALSKRHTSREFSQKEVSLQMVSDLLWAAFGINRENGKRTAPSSHNRQEAEIYVAMKDGAYYYDAHQNALVKISDEDIREFTGKQDFVKDAPLTLVFVADFTKMGDGPDHQKEITANTDAAFISQNVYLYCASEGLNTGVRAWIDKDILSEKLNLKESQHITLAQCVGYPKE